MGQPYRINFYNLSLKRWKEQTLGSETSQYQEEKRPIGIPWVAASETGKAQTQPQNLDMSASSCVDFGDGGYKATALATGRVKKCWDRGTRWEARLQRVIVPYSKTKDLYGCSSWVIRDMNSSGEFVSTNW